MHDTRSLNVNVTYNSSTMYKDIFALGRRDRFLVESLVRSFRDG